MKADIEDVRNAFVDYLAMKPSKDRVTQVYDVVRYMVEADQSVATVEDLVLEELRLAVQAYVQSSVAVTRFEVLIVPQDEAHRQRISEMLGRREPMRRSGGLAFVAGCYFSERFAQAMCERYHGLGFFSTAERTGPRA